MWIFNAISIYFYCQCYIVLSVPANTVSFNFLLINRGLIIPQISIRKPQIIKVVFLPLTNLTLNMYPCKGLLPLMVNLREE